MTDHLLPARLPWPCRFTPGAAVSIRLPSWRQRSTDVTFAGVLRKLRTDARLTQEELAAAAGLSLRAVSDLERGVVTTPHKDTVRLLADALHLIGPAPGRVRGGRAGPRRPGRDRRRGSVGGDPDPAA